jgi:2-keto-4-pentenoate hydratase/2-oxohepta-3-ene-1,7-dioic acid hydratase in catechol pathway
MKLAQFRKGLSGQQRLGALFGEYVVDVGALAREVQSVGGQVAEWLPALNSTLEVIRSGPDAIEAIAQLITRAGEEAVSLNEDVISAPQSIEYLPAVNAGKILAIGRNYADHAIEQGEKPPSSPMIFNKLPNSLSAHNAPIVLPAISEKIDYEAELAVVIGRRASRVREDEALEFVFGYTLINDVSARDLQFADGQWTRGKGLDGFAPLGPFITTRDEIADVHNLKIEGRLNGEVMQTSNTAKMIFKIPYLISYLSQGITLEPGDVIATGTPEGVGIFRKPPVLLKAGDVFEVFIEKLGTLRNPVK